MRAYQFVPIILIALALPASAQQSDRSLRHQIESVVSSYAENFQQAECIRYCRSVHKGWGASESCRPTEIYRTVLPKCIQSRVQSSRYSSRGCFVSRTRCSDIDGWSSH